MPLPPEAPDDRQSMAMYRARAVSRSVSIFWAPQAISMRRSDEHATLYELEREFGYGVMLDGWVQKIETPRVRQARRRYYAQHKRDLAALVYWG